MGALGRITKKMNKARQQRVDDASSLIRTFNDFDANMIPGAFTRTSYTVGEHTHMMMEISKSDLEARVAHLTGRDTEIVYVDELEQVVPPHGNKYPKHAMSRKGSIFQGECNRTACENVDARFYNKGTYGYYCAPCGHAINGRRAGDARLCIEVDHNLTHEEMNALYGKYTI